jgi:hypothetical protein
VLALEIVAQACLVLRKKTLGYVRTVSGELRPWDQKRQTITNCHRNNYIYWQHQAARQSNHQTNKRGKTPATIDHQGTKIDDQQ